VATHTHTAARCPGLWGCHALLVTETLRPNPDLNTKKEVVSTSAEPTGCAGVQASAVDDVMQTLQQRLAATPSMAAEILRLASAVVEAVPARVRPEAVVRLWEAALLAVLGQDELCAVRAF
jgi:hypothetical protein